MTESEYQGTYESYGDWKRRVFCENSSTRAGGIVTPRCTSGKKQYECTVTYDEWGIDSDTLMLCDECKKTLRKGAIRSGYRFRSKRVA